MVTTNIIVRELSKMKEQDFAKFLKRFMKDIEVKQHIFERQEELERQIVKYSNYLNFTEHNMLRTLNENCLLLSFKEEIGWDGNVYLVAYNLDRQVVLKNLYQINSKKRK